jgi:hypothetical protein
MGIIANTRQDKNKKEKKRENKNKKDVDRLREDDGSRIFWVEDRASFLAVGPIHRENGICCFFSASWYW